MIEIRYMKLILMFDLPSQEENEKKEYRLFHKNLLKNGFFMMQYSIYVKTVNAVSKINREIEKIKKFVPTNGNVRVLSVTEKQYNNMVLVLGHKNINEIYNDSRRYIKI